MKRITRLQTSHYKASVFRNCSMLCTFCGTESEGMNRILRDRKRVSKILFIVLKKYSNILFFV
jgi:adenine C2-methylase RlmN of 23S rRNA A2503 and tRNA A37